MCLFPGSFSNMQPVVPPSQNGLKHKRILFGVILVQLVLSILVMFFSISTGLMSLILTVVLWCGNSRMSHCLLIFYMVYILFDFLKVISVIGLVTPRQYRRPTGYALRSRGQLTAPRRCSSAARTSWAFCSVMG